MLPARTARARGLDFATLNLPRQTKAQKAAADRAAQIMAPASLASSEAASAHAIFTHVDEQQDDLVAAGLDPVKVFGKLLNYAGTLSQSAKSRLVSAQVAASAR